MPTDTFLNLDENKKNTVRKALINEFTASPLELCSIKNIVTDAGIPRGSFYQYFTDKEDALRYVISETGHDKEISLEAANLYNLIIHLFNREVQTLSSNEESIRLQLILQIARSPRATTIFNEEITAKTIRSPEFNLLLERSHLERLNSDQSRVLMELLISSFRDAMLKTLSDSSRIREIRENLELKLKIIEMGVNDLLLK